MTLVLFYSELKKKREEISMAKKLCVISFLAVVVIFSSLSIYAERGKNIPVIIETTVDEEVMMTMAAAMTGAEEYAEEQEAIRIAREKEEKEMQYLQGLSAYIRHVNRNVSKEEAETMASSFVRCGKKYGVDEKMVMAVAQTESAYDADAVSCADFKGLMQTGDGLARNAGYDPGELFQPEISIKVGASYLRDKMAEFGDMRLALTAYNQGSGSVYSGNYTTGYADITMERAEAVDAFLTRNGYQ